MKKLITMLATVATAFGLYAADDGFLSGAGFDTSDTENPANGDYTWLMGEPTGDFVTGYWTGADKTSIIAEKYTYTGTHPVQFDDDSNRDYDQYLKIDSGTNLVSQSILPGGSVQTIGDDGLYFDGLVQFTSYEDDMPAIDAGAKIALFPMVDNPEDDTPTSSLWISASGNSSNLWKTASIEDGWHRVTIKMINNIYKKGAETEKVGFVVYIDGVEVSCTDAKIVDETNLTSEAKFFNKYGNLFVSLGDSAEMTDVAFSGKGAIDEIAFTETAPSFAVSPKYYTITWDETVASVNGSTEAFEDQVTGEAATYTYVAAEGYIDGTTNITGAAGETYTIKAAKLGAAVYKWDESAEDWVAVQGGQVSTFADALALVDNTGKFKIALAQDEGAIMIDKACDLTIDLAGKTVDGAITLTAGALTIEDSSKPQTGKVTGVVSTTVMAGLGVAGLTINAGIYDGAVSLLPPMAATINDGKFEATANAANITLLTAKLGANRELVLEDGYYVVKTVTDFTVTVPEKKANTTLAVTIDDVAAGDTNGVYTVAKASTLKAVYTADEGYELDGEGEFTVTYATKDTVVIDAPTAIATAYTITIAEGGEGASATPATYTIESFEGENDLTVTLDAGTAPTDKQFKAWTKDVDDSVATIEGNTLTILNGQLANITVTATWDDIAYVAQVGNDKFLTTEAALAKVWELEAVPTFPITVTCLAEDGFTVTYGDPAQSVTLAKDETIVITAGNWKFDAFSGNVVLAPGKTITAKSIADGATITTIAGYKVVKSDTTDEGGYYTWSVVEAAYFTIGEGTDKYYTAADLKTALAGETAPTVFVHGVMPADQKPVYATGMTGLTIKAAAAGDGFSGDMSFGSTYPNLVVDGITFKEPASGNHVTINGLIGGLFKNCAFEGDRVKNFAIVGGNGATDGNRLEGCTFNNYYRGGVNINCNTGKTTIVGCTFQNSVAPDRGAVQCASNGGVIYVEGCTFKNLNGSAMLIHESSSNENSVIVFNNNTFESTVRYLCCDERKAGSKLNFYWGGNTVAAEVDTAKALMPGKTLEDPEYVYPQVSFTTSLPTGITYADWDGAKFKLPADDTTQYTLAEIEAMARGTAFLVKPGYAAPAATVAYTVEAAEVANCDFAYQLKTAMYDITFTDAAEWTNVVSTAYGATPAPTEQVPEKVGYTITGWNPAIATVTGAATYTAVYTVNQYDVTFSTNNIPVAEAATKVAHGATLEAIQIPTFEGGTWDVDPATAVIICATNFNYTIKAEEPVEPVVPGTPIDCKDDTEATNLAVDINKDPTLKAQYLKAPAGATVDTAVYNAYFDAVATGTKVTFELSQEGKEALQDNVDDEIVKIKPADIAAGTATSVEIAEPIAGFYYAVKQGYGIGQMKVVYEGVLATGSNTVDLKLDQFQGAGFYQVVVSEKPIAAEK